MSGAQRVEATWRCLSFFSDTDYLKWLFPTSMRSNLYRICYSPWGQEFSICNYWHGKLGRRVGGTGLLCWGPRGHGTVDSPRPPLTQPKQWFLFMHTY